jgi:hypothetical protein
LAHLKRRTELIELFAYASEAICRDVWWLLAKPDSASRKYPRFPIVDYDLFSFFCLFGVESERPKQQEKLAQSHLTIHRSR